MVPPRSPRRAPTKTEEAADVVQPPVRVDRDRRRRRCPAMIVAVAAVAAEVIAAVAAVVAVIATAAARSAAWTGRGTVRIGSIGRHTAMMRRRRMGRWWW